MNTKSTLTILAIISLLLGCAASLAGQAQGDIVGRISSAERPAIAVADMRGTGDAQRNMDTFNSTLWDELSNAGILKMVAKSVYPLEVPQKIPVCGVEPAHGSVEVRGLSATFVGAFVRPPLILAPVTAPFLIFGAVTAFFFSCCVPTLFAGRLTAA